MRVSLTLPPKRFYILNTGTHRYACIYTLNAVLVHGQKQRLLFSVSDAFHQASGIHNLKRTQSLVTCCRLALHRKKTLRGAAAIPQSVCLSVKRCHKFGEKNIHHSHHIFFTVSTKFSTNHDLQEDIKQLSDCLCLCAPAAGSYNPYPSPQRDAWFASHLCSQRCLALD